MGPGAADMAEIIPEIHHKLAGLETPQTGRIVYGDDILFDSRSKITCNGKFQRLFSIARIRYTWVH